MGKSAGGNGASEGDIDLGVKRKVHVAVGHIATGNPGQRAIRLAGEVVVGAPVIEDIALVTITEIGHAELIIDLAAVGISMAFLQAGVIAHQVAFHPIHAVGVGGIESDSSLSVEHLAKQGGGGSSGGIVGRPPLFGITNVAIFE